MDTLYQINDRLLLTDLLNGEGSHLGPAAILDGLSPEQAFAKPHGLPHSIADLVAHMHFWQKWFNACLATGFTPPPASAADGWPAVGPGQWEVLREGFLQSIEDAKRLIAESDSLGECLLPPGVEIPPLMKETLGSGILHAAVHSSHHLGQIITIRQLLGAWPPAAGSMTW